MTAILRQRRDPVSALAPGILVLVSVAACAVGDRAGPSIPLYELHEEWRIESNDSSVESMLSSISDGSPVLPDGRLLAISTGEAVIRVFDSTGRFVTMFGRKGDGPNEFRRPATGGFVGDTIYIMDTQRRRYFLLDSSFAPIGSIVWPAGGGAYMGVVAGGVSVLRTGDSAGIYDKDGTLIRNLDAFFGTPEEFKFNMEYLGQVRTMSSPIAPRAAIGVVPGGREAIIVQPAAAFGGRPGELAILRVTLPDGRISDPTIVTLDPVRTDARIGDSLIAASAAGFTGVDQDAYRARAKLPEYLPAFSYLSMVGDSVVWLKQFLDDSTRLVISTTGQVLMRLRVPGRFYPLSVSVTRVWALTFDSLDVPVLVKYRIQAVPH